MGASQVRSAPVQFSLRSWEAIRTADYATFFSPRHWVRLCLPLTLTSKKGK